MKSAEIKKKLIEKINLIDNIELLEEYNSLLNNVNTNTLIFEFSDSQKAKIQLSKDQLKKGEFLSENEANKEISEWLEK